MNESSLDQAIVWTQLVLLGLCAIRARADLLTGPLTIEGGIAALLAIFLAASLGGRIIGWMLRRAIDRGGFPRPPASWALESKDAHAR